MQLGTAINWKKVLQGMDADERWDFLTTQGPDYVLSLADIMGASPGHDANSILIHTTHGMIELDKVQGGNLLEEWKEFVIDVTGELK